MRTSRPVLPRRLAAGLAADHVAHPTERFDSGIVGNVYVRSRQHPVGRGPNSGASSTSTSPKKDSPSTNQPPVLPYSLRARSLLCGRRLLRRNSPAQQLPAPRKNHAGLLSDPDVMHAGRRARRYYIT